MDCLRFEFCKLPLKHLVQSFLSSVCLLSPDDIQTQSGYARSLSALMGSFTENSPDVFHELREELPADPDPTLIRAAATLASVSVPSVTEAPPSALPECVNLCFSLLTAAIATRGEENLAAALLGELCVPAARALTSRPETEVVALVPDIERGLRALLCSGERAHTEALFPAALSFARLFDAFPDSLRAALTGAALRALWCPSASGLLASITRKRALALLRALAAQERADTVILFARSFEALEQSAVHLVVPVLAGMLGRLITQNCTFFELFPSLGVHGVPAPAATLLEFVLARGLVHEQNAIRRYTVSVMTLMGTDELARALGVPSAVDFTPEFFCGVVAKLLGQPSCIRLNYASEARNLLPCARLPSGDFLARSEALRRVCGLAGDLPSAHTHDEAATFAYEGERKPSPGFDKRYAQHMRDVSVMILARCIERRPGDFFPSNEIAFLSASFANFASFLGRAAFALLRRSLAVSAVDALALLVRIISPCENLHLPPGMISAQLMIQSALAAFDDTPDASWGDAALFEQARAFSSLWFDLYTRTRPSLPQIHRGAFEQFAMLNFKAFLRVFPPELRRALLLDLLKLNSKKTVSLIRCLNLSHEFFAVDTGFVEGCSIAYASGRDSLLLSAALCKDDDGPLCAMWESVGSALSAFDRGLPKPCAEQLAAINFIQRLLQHHIPPPIAVSRQILLFAERRLSAASGGAVSFDLIFPTKRPGDSPLLGVITVVRSLQTLVDSGLALKKRPVPFCREGGTTPVLDLCFFAASLFGVVSAARELARAVEGLPAKPHLAGPPSRAGRGAHRTHAVEFATRQFLEALPSVDPKVLSTQISTSSSSREQREELLSLLQAFVITAVASISISVSTAKQALALPGEEGDRLGELLFKLLKFLMRTLHASQTRNFISAVCSAGPHVPLAQQPLLISFLNTVLSSAAKAPAVLDALATSLGTTGSGWLSDLLSTDDDECVLELEKLFARLLRHAHATSYMACSSLLPLFAPALKSRSSAFAPFALSVLAFAPQAENEFYAVAAMLIPRDNLFATSEVFSSSFSVRLRALVELEEAAARMPPIERADLFLRLFDAFLDPPKGSRLVGYPQIPPACQPLAFLESGSRHPLQFYSIACALRALAATICENMPAPCAVELMRCAEECLKRFWRPKISLYLQEPMEQTISMILAGVGLAEAGNPLQHTPRLVLQRLRASRKDMQQVFPSAGIAVAVFCAASASAWRDRVDAPSAWAFCEAAVQEIFPYTFSTNHILQGVAVSAIVLLEDAGRALGGGVAASAETAFAFEQVRRFVSTTELSRSISGMLERDNPFKRGSGGLFPRSALSAVVAPSQLVSALRFKRAVGAAEGQAPLSEAPGPRAVAWPELSCENLQQKIETSGLLPTTPKGKLDTGLIVCASLIDSPPLLGGLVRTAEIFQVQELVVPSLSVTREPSFQATVVTADRWLPLREVAPDSLAAFLVSQARRGYRIVGLEYAHTATPLARTRLSKRTLLLLGGTHTGIPPGVARLCHEFATVPPLGHVAALGAQVSASLFVYEYARQNLLEPRASAKPQ
eukprot:gnl/Chilomastix_cuspidata/4752.p1 GENE.gnl/Chilomastix_cuspidata/4752~~gnl/Chilomastix_cuspidata/4752.p1  ORF type:complete len:1626 (+),score=442.55 gnl/Chilomastix_cuspidata/4752:209-4879(+)